MARIRNRHKQIHPVRNGIFSNGAGIPLKPRTSSLPQYYSPEEQQAVYGVNIAGYGAQRGRRKVFVGLSGGVDSSVSAALLKEAGFDAHGVFIKTWSPNWLPCVWKEERQDAMRVAAHLDIPFTTLDLEKEYKRDVADYMVSEYQKGRTPNPDVFCNRFVKFGGFYDFAIKEGADFVATGHYARVKELSAFSFQLLAGRDKNKDQSYFLWTLKQIQLGRVLFPVGGLIKPEVRRLAKKFGLPTAEKKDSQGLCFLGKIDLREFLSHYLPPKRGDVLIKNGEVIGWHDGVQFFTEGERHGFHINDDRKGMADAPYYVIAKDIKKNTLTVSIKNSSRDLPNVARDASLSDVNWISSEPQIGETYQARFRYRAPLADCVVERREKSWRISFKTPQNFVTPGQSLVVYDGEAVLGGGVIEEAG